MRLPLIAGGCYVARAFGDLLTAGGESHVSWSSFAMLQPPALQSCTPELRAALAHECVAVPGSSEARHVGGLTEAQVRPRVQQLLCAAGIVVTQVCWLQVRGTRAAQRLAGANRQAAAAASGGHLALPGTYRNQSARSIHSPRASLNASSCGGSIGRATGAKLSDGVEFPQRCCGDQCCKHSSEIIQVAE